MVTADFTIEEINGRSVVFCGMQRMASFADPMRAEDYVWKTQGRVRFHVCSPTEQGIEGVIVRKGFRIG